MRRRVGAKRFEVSDYDSERVFSMASLTGHVELKCEPNRLKGPNRSLTLSYYFSHSFNVI